MKVTAAEMIDMPQDVFESSVRKMGMTVGDASNLSFFLKSTYMQSVAAKDLILKKIKSGEVGVEEAGKNLKDLYLLMQDIENKSVFIESYIKNINDVAEGT